MKFHKRALAFALAFILLLALSAPALAGAAPERYTDVPADGWQAEYVSAVTEAGIMGGTGDGQFDPNGQLSRAMFVTMLYRVAGSPVVSGETPFSDAQAGSWYSAALKWAHDNGLVLGYPDGRFGPDESISREQMVTLLYRYVGLFGALETQYGEPVGSGISDFPDASGVSDYAREAFDWSVKTGIVNGMSGKLYPNILCLRAQAAAVIARFLGLTGKPALSPSPTPNSTFAPNIHETETTTRADIENALMETAWGFYFKGNKMQYGSQELNVKLGTNGVSGGYDNYLRKFWGGAWRSNLYSTLEDATSDNTIYTVCSDFPWSVYYYALDYSLYGHRLNGLTNGQWMFSEREGMTVMRYAPVGFTSEAASYGAGEDTSLIKTLDETVEFLTNYEDNLRPGDILITDAHTQLYLGEGYVIDSWGSKYNMTTGVEAFEKAGTVDGELHTLLGIFVDGTEQGGSFKLDKCGYFAVIRPLDALCADDGDENPGNDPLDSAYVQPRWDDLKYPENLKTSGFDITGETLTRLEYPGMEIDRTVSGTQFGSAVSGGTLTYSVKISNMSDTADYCTWRGAYYGSEYSGEDYSGLAVTETVPDGTELVAGSVSSGGAASGGVISWTLDIPKGQSVTLSYTVNVTAGRGAAIVNDGGMVGRIPSNSISNSVGGAKLSETAETAMQTFFAAGRNKWNDTDENGGYNISVTATDTVFAERVYAKVLGKTLELPTTAELLNGLFQNTLIEEDSGWYVYGEIGKSVYMYTQRDEVADEYRVYKDMLVPGYLGGVYVKTDAYSLEPRINEFRLDYLEPGDVLIYAELSSYSAIGEARDVKSGEVLVYLGEGDFAAISSNGVLRSYEDSAAVCWKAFSSDFFICLRPSLAYADIESNLPDYDTANEPDPDENAGNVEAADAYALYGTQPLSAANQTKIAALTAGNNSVVNANYAWNSYKNAGMSCVLSVMNNGMSYANFLTGVIFNSPTVADEENYRYARVGRDETTNSEVYNMLIGGWYGGRCMTEQGTTSPTLASLQVGDVVLLGMRKSELMGYGSGKGTYRTCLYQGNGKFIINDRYFIEYDGNTGSLNTGKPFYSKTYDETTWAEMLAEPHWEAWFALRPSQGFANINAQPLSAANQAKIAALTPDQFGTGTDATNAAFGWKAYALCGMDFVKTDAGSITTYSGVLTAIFAETTGGSTPYTYTVRSAAPTDAAKPIYSMLVHGYFGGNCVASLGGVETPVLSDLQIGDILLLGMRNNNTLGTDGVYTTAVYQGSGKFIYNHRYYISYDAEGTPSFVGGSAGRVWDSMTLASDEEFAAYLAQPHWQAWMLLRPSQAYDDINAQGAPPAEPAGAPLSDANKAIIAAVELTTEQQNGSGTGNLNFAKALYEEALGVVFTDSGNYTYSTLVAGKLFVTTNGEYTPVAAPVSDYEEFYYMLLDGYYGGSKMTTEGVAANAGKTTDLSVGDILVGGYLSPNVTNQLEYWVGVYQGDGKFIVCRMWKPVGASSNSREFFVKTYTASEYTSLLDNSGWEAWFVLRPSRAFDDINTLVTTP